MVLVVSDPQIEPRRPAAAVLTGRPVFAGAAAAGTAGTLVVTPEY